MIVIEPLEDDLLAADVAVHCLHVVDDYVFAVFVKFADEVFDRNLIAYRSVSGSCGCFENISESGIVVDLSVDAEFCQIPREII